MKKRIKTEMKMKSNSFVPDFERYWSVEGVRINGELKRQMNVVKSLFLSFLLAFYSRKLMSFYILRVFLPFSLSLFASFFCASLFLFSFNITPTFPPSHFLYWQRSSWFFCVWNNKYIDLLVQSSVIIYMVFPVFFTMYLCVCSDISSCFSFSFSSQSILIFDL